MMKKHFKRLLLLLAAVLIVLAVILVVILYNPRLIRGSLESHLSEAAGYPINLEGKIEVQLGSLSTVTARQVHISGPQWAQHTDLLSVSYLRLSTRTSSLFTDTIILESLEVEGLQLNLETDTEGKASWTNTKPPAPPKAVDDTGVIVIFNDIEAKNMSLRFRNGKTGKDNEFNITSLSHHQQADHMLYTTLKGELNGRPVDYTHDIGPYENLLNGRDVRFDVDGELGDLSISGNGLIDDFRKPRHPVFELKMQGPDIDEITDMLDIDDLGSGGFDLNTRGALVNDIYTIGVDGKVGDTSLDVSAQTSHITQLDELDLELDINGPSLGALTRAFGVEDFPDEPFSLNGGIERIGKTLNVRGLDLDLGTTEMELDALLTNFPGLDASRIKLTVLGDDVSQFEDLLGVSGGISGPFNFKGKLDTSPDGLEILLAELETSLGHATISGTLGPSPAYIGSKLQTQVEGLNARSLLALFGVDALPEQPFTLNTQLEVVDNGLLIERGVLLTMQDERLDMGGLITFNPGIVGTDLEVVLSGDDLSEILQRLVHAESIPGRPYKLGGRVRVMDEGIQLDNVIAEFERAQLKGGGLLRTDNRLHGSSFNFQINGEDISGLRKFKAIGDSLDILLPGQAYLAEGVFSIDTNGWHLSDIGGRVGETELGFNALISDQPGLSGSNLRFSMKGPGLDQLLFSDEDVNWPDQPFESGGLITLTNDKLRIETLKFETPRAHANINVDMDWPLSSTMDASFNIDVRGEDIRTFLPPTELFKPNMVDFKLKAIGQQQGGHVSLQELDANVGNLELSMLGNISRNPDGGDSVASFKVISEDLSQLGQLNGRDLPAEPLEINSDFKGSASHYSFDNLNLSLGESRLEGIFVISLTGQKPRLEVEAQSDYFDVRPYFDPVIQDNDDKDPADSPGNERAIPDTPLPLDTLAGIDARISVNIAELQHHKARVGNLVLEAVVEAGSLDVSDFSFEAPLGRVRSSFSILPRDSGKADVKVSLEADGVVLNISGLPRDKLSEVPFLDLDFKASGRGSNLQEIAGSTNGTLYLESDGGTLDGVNLGVLEASLLDQVFSLILPDTPDQENVILTCAATILNITDGLVETNPAMAVTSNQMAIIAKGSLDLKTESLNFNFNATPNNAFKISASELFNPYILVGGTLKKPEVGIDPQKALLHGGAALGTAGISILAKGLVDRVGNAVPLCEEMQETIEQRKADFKR